MSERPNDPEGPYTLAMGSSSPFADDSVLPRKNGIVMAFPYGLVDVTE